MLGRVKEHGKKPAGQWLITIVKFPGSSMVVAPMTLHGHLGPAWQYLKVAKMDAPMLTSVFDEREIEVIPLKRRGPAWLQNTLSRPLGKTEFGMVAERLSAALPLFTLACEKAFMLFPPFLTPLFG